MPSDLYVPRGSHPNPSGLIPRTVFSGVGAPTDTSGIPPNALYINESNGSFYKFENGSWVLKFTDASGGGGGAVQIGGDLDPNGIHTGAIGELYFSSPALGGDGSLWTKSADDGLNTGWNA